MMTAPGALQGLRVLDLSDEKGQYCTTLMADMGTDVIKIEPPADDPVRHMGPFYHDEEDLDKSLYWFVLNTSKRGLTLDIITPRGADLFRRLAATADFVVESFVPGTMDQLGLGYEVLQQQRPNLILTSVSNYGQTGPYRGYAATDLDILGMSGTLFVCGDPDRAPTRVNAPQTPIYAGIQAFVGSLLAHYHRLESGEGQQVDVSLHEGATLLHYSQLIWNAYGLVMVRLGDRPEALDVQMAAWTATQTSQEVVQRLQAIGVASGMVQNARDLACDPQLQQRQHYVTLQHPEMGDNVVDQFGFRLSKTPGDRRMRRQCWASMMRKCLVSF